MKAFKNRLEEMAEATVNALDYSDSKVEYPDLSLVQKWPEEIILPLYALYKNAGYSELSSILMYTQQQVRFEEIGELMLGIGLVEMVHYDKLGDFLLKASDIRSTNELTINPSIKIGTFVESALELALQAEKETLEEYKKVLSLINQEKYLEREDYVCTFDLISKFIADEEYHIILLGKAMRKDEEPKKKGKSITVIL